MAFEMEQVVGTGSVQTLICQPITFPAPAEEVKEIRKTVIVDNCMPVIDKVIVDGRLRKDILFKQANAGFPLPGNVSACTGIIATVTGPVMDVDVDIAFNALITVPGARPGDRCVVLQAFVEGEKEEAADINTNGSFNTLVDKSIVFLCVKANVSKTGPVRSSYMDLQGIQHARNGGQSPAASSGNALPLNFQHASNMLPTYSLHGYYILAISSEHGYYTRATLIQHAACIKLTQLLNRSKRLPR